jgi:transposase-like protein
MTKSNTSHLAIASSLPSPQESFDDVRDSFERFCLLSGIEAMEQMLEEDANALCGERHARNKERKGHRWGTSKGSIGFHGGKTKIKRPRVRGRDKKEISLPSWTAAREEDWLGKWAMNLMLINVSTRKFGRAVRLPEGDIAVKEGDGTSKSAASRRFVALSAVKMKAWMSADLSKRDLLVIQIDGLHIKGELVLIGAVGIDAEGHKHPLALVDGATENTAVVQALLDDLVERGLDPEVCRLFILDGAKALKKAVRNTFGKHTPIQRCQVHKARNILDRLPKGFHASTKKALRQAWETGDADKGEKLLRNLARRLEKEAPGVSGSILEGIDDILTVTRLDLPDDLRRSLACTNIIENMMGTIRRVTGNVKHWRNAKMALRWTAAGMMEAKKGFRRIRAYKQLPQLRAALLAHQKQHQKNTDLDRQAKAA